MMTLLVPLFYLWLAITILLVAMFFLHRHDLRRSREDEDQFIEASPVRSGVDATDDQPDRTEIDPDPIPTPEIENDGPHSNPVDQTDQTDQTDQPERAKCSLVGDLLRGVSLPHDLTPATERITQPERHAILISPNSDAEEVGTAFADELTRIGFAIEPDGLDQARAVRDGEVLMLKICPQAGTRGSGGYRRYPSAAAGDVAIEIWTGQDGPPRLAR